LDFGFQGQFRDVETGWYNYGYRFYVPLLGRWINRDPIAERGGKNLYKFTGNNSKNRLDRFGLEIEVSTNFPCPNCVRVDYVHSGVSGTRYPNQSVDCYCDCIEGRWHVANCNVGFDAHITVSFAEAEERRQAWWKILGHEQRHIVDKVRKVESEIVRPLAQSTRDYESKIECDNGASTLAKYYRIELSKILTFDSERDHDDDPSTDAPGNAEGYSPLPGSEPIFPSRRR
jgi:RHS repeat-associated protein